MTYHAVNNKLRILQMASPKLSSWQLLSPELGRERTVAIRDNYFPSEQAGLRPIAL